MKESNETYLGDGLYASFDGFHIILRAPRIGGDHYVALESSVCRSFIVFARACGMNCDERRSYYADGQAGEAD